MTALLLADGALGPPELLTSAGLDFDYGQALSVPRNQVKLLSAMARPIVARHHRIAESAQVVVSKIFPPPSVAEVPRQGTLSARPQPFP